MQREELEHESHASPGGLTREQLEPLLDEGLSYIAAARRLGVSPGTVRRWATKLGLESKRAARRREAAALDATAKTALLTCRSHGQTEFVREARGYFRCLRCRQDFVTRRRKELKRILVEEAGGACHVCGYDRHVGALHFHHVDPGEKNFGIAARGFTKSLDRLRTEARKCVLLCGNCHAEVEAGLLEVPALKLPAGTTVPSGGPG